MGTMRVSAKPFHEKSYEKKEYHEADDEQPTLILCSFVSFALLIFFQGTHCQNSLKFIVTVF